MAKKYSYIVLLIIGLFGLSTMSIGQNPNWMPPNASSYKFNASVIAKFRIDGIESSHNNDRIAFYSGNQLRGLSIPVQIGNLGTVHFITLFSNIGTEPMTIKLYKFSTNTVYEAETTYTFMAQSIKGSIEEPFIILGYTDNDAPFSLGEISGQMTMSGMSYEPIQLDDYLIRYDMDSILWTAVPNPNLTYSFNGMELQVHSVSGFIGETQLTITATEQTPNQYAASQTINFVSTAPYLGPQFGILPDQGIVVGDVFEFFNLTNYQTQYGGSCEIFDYAPLMQVSNPPIPNPNWTLAGSYQNTMTVTVKVQFSPKYNFSHPEDRLVAMIGGQVRGVASPFTQGGATRYYLSIGGDSQMNEVELKFYSGYQKKIYNNIDTVHYKAYRNIGSPLNPRVIDLAPIIPDLDFNGGVQMMINDSNWLGEQAYSFTAKDCSYPEVLKATASAKFCIVEDTTYLMTFYKDYDGDGYGNPSYSIKTCSAPLAGYVSNALDCDDNNPLSIALPVHIQATEYSGYAFNDDFICAGSAAVLTASGGSSILWSNGASGYENYISPTETTIYMVTVTNENGCVGSDSKTIGVEGTVVKNSGNAGNQSLRSVLDCIVSGGTITYDQPNVMTTILTNPLTVSKNVTIQGLNTNSKPIIHIDFNSSNSGFTIINNNTMNLKNIDIMLINPGSKDALKGMGKLNILESTSIYKQ